MLECSRCLLGTAPYSCVARTLRSAVRLDVENDADDDDDAAPQTERSSRAADVVVDEEEEQEW